MEEEKKCSRCKRSYLADSKCLQPEWREEDNKWYCYFCYTPKEWKARNDKDKELKNKVVQIKKECPTPREFHQETYDKLFDVDPQAAYYYSENFRIRKCSPWV